MAKISLDQLRKAASSGRRSTLYHWMRENHARISEALADAGRPNWEALAETFAKAGLTDRSNRPPTAAAARQTWHKVRTALVKQQTAVPTNRPRTASTTAALPSQPPTQPGETTARVQGRSYTFTQATLRKAPTQETE
jgi:hypothetical protein